MQVRIAPNLYMHGAQFARPMHWYMVVWSGVIVQKQPYWAPLATDWHREAYEARYIITSSANVDTCL